MYSLVCTELTMILEINFYVVLGVMVLFEEVCLALDMVDMCSINILEKSS
jgi:hypothetical protein